jgi:excisionase family DNA binding protein
MPPPHIEKTFCTTREAAALLGVSIGTVQLWVESDLLQAWKTAGGHRRVLRDSVDRLLHKSVQVPSCKQSRPLQKKNAA